MLNKKHKRKVSRIIIFTTDAVDAEMKQVRIRPWVVTVLTVLVCCLLGGIIGYAVYETQLWQLEKDKDVRLEGSMGELEAEIAQLKDELLLKENEIAIRDEKIEALSSAFNAQSDEMDALKNELSQQSLPSDYPLTGSAGIEESNEGDPMVIFSAEEGITVIASANGKVTGVETDDAYGNRVIIDHGNGYVSIYRNKGEVQVKVGDEVSRGTTLFLIGEDNKQLGYQIMKNSAYINPMEMLSING